MRPEQAKNTVRLAMGMLLAANGAAMLLFPAAWYVHMPGVSTTGPFNPHFVRDIGAAYFVAGSGLVWLWRTPQAWPAALAGSSFLLLHALIHVGEAAITGLDWHHLRRDLAGVFFTPLLALWLAWPRHKLHSTKESSNATMDRTAQARSI